VKATPKDPGAPRARVALRVIRPGAPPPAARSRTDVAAQTATQRIVDSITAAIAERRLMPGTKLAEQKLADIFRVSRTLVRQALNQLSRDRLVLLRPARGATVAAPSVSEARQVFEARQLIEGAMIRQLARRITPQQIAELRAHLQAERAGIQRTDISGRTRLLADFHVVLARLLGNEVLAQLLHDLLTRSSLIALMYQSTHSAQASYDEHVAIVDALERGDARDAARLTLRHLGSVERNLRLDPRRPDLALVLNPKA
jgi:DNA-binding GntR family transcriptional regulator